MNTEPNIPAPAPKTSQAATHPAPSAQRPTRHSRSAPDTKPLIRTRRRTGNVARLPAFVREKLNLMLRDGIPYTAIIEKLGEHGKNLNPDILSRWHGTGYHDWLEEQSWLEEMRARLDFASEIVHEKNVDFLNEAGLRIALSQMYTLLLNFDPSAMSRKMQVQPNVYPRLINALCKLADGALKYESRRNLSLNPL